MYQTFETIQLRNVSNVYYYIELTCYLCFLLCWARSEQKREKLFLKEKKLFGPEHPEQVTYHYWPLPTHYLVSEWVRECTSAYEDFKKVELDTIVLYLVLIGTVNTH